MIFDSRDGAMEAFVNLTVTDVRGHLFKLGYSDRDNAAFINYACTYGCYHNRRVTIVFDDHFGTYGVIIMPISR